MTVLPERGSFQDEPVDIGGGVVMHHAVPYGVAALHGEEKPLHVDLYYPCRCEARMPLFVWFHSGAFRNGTYSHVSHKVMARWLGKRGIALATPEYRLGAVRSDLTPGVRALLDDLRDLRSRRFRRDLAQARSFAALEDSLTFLSWMNERREGLGVGGKVVLGGSSAGAINAFNICFTAPFLGLEPLVEFGGIIGFSGGYAYPSLYRPEKIPVVAVHNPSDDRVSIASIRELAKRDPALKLIESPDQEHGGVRLSRIEPKSDAYERVAAYVWQMSGLESP